MSDRVICCCVICSVLAVSFVTAQYEVWHAVSIFTECELCLTVICYVLFLAVSFVTVQCELCLAVSFVTCNMSCFGQHRLCCCAMWVVSSGVIYYGAE